MSFLTFYITHANEAEAKKLSDQLIEEKLVACANLFPIQSAYRWKGEVVNEAEWVSLVKTSKAMGRRVEARVLELHPYETPCIMRTEVAANEAYERWIEDVVKESP